ncbi:uncharacterized protein LOC142503634 [Ascaphus truei]|uniref:uncharacterized protein LOC142503634 n=1 Tax=Ascaphus truei TaxID=8439 RepID=UPI003F596981
MSGPCCPEAVFWLLLLVRVMAKGAAENTCDCIILENWASNQSALVPEACCLNFSLSVDSLEWNIFTSLTNLRVLDLSHSGITQITDVEEGRKPTHIEVLYIDHNHLKELPKGFLSNAPNLKVLHLENNHLAHLPPNFLLLSDLIEEVNLSFNNLTSVPSSILKPSLSRFGFLNNSLDCTCALFDSLHPNFHTNDTSGVLEELTCASPKDVSGFKVKDVQRSSVCRSHNLTVILICIPLLVVLGLLCWYLCCRRRKGSYSNTRRECNLVTVDRNGAGSLGEHHYYEPRQQFHKDRWGPEGEQLKDPILLKPSAALLGSSRDLYEEVEIKLGTSADSLVEGEGQISREGPGLILAVEEVEDDEGEMNAGDEPEVETVSVTEVMKDSTDREKLYMNQATDYYSLVPGIELEDSDHCEYESVDLS